MKVIHKRSAPSIWRSYKYARAIAFAMALTAVFLPTHTTALAQSNGGLNATYPRPTYAARIVLPVFGKRNIVFDEPVISLTVIDPEFVRAELSGAVVTLTGLAQGETIVIVSGKSHRQTFAVEVKGPLIPTPEQIAARALREQRQRAGPSGSYTLSFSPALGGGPSVLRQSFDYRRQLSNNRALRIEGNTFKFFGRGDRALTYNSDPGFGLDRLSLGVDAPEGKLDLLDSELNVSPLSLNAYTMRGIHLVSSPDSQLRGVEFFAGLARPSFNPFENSSGYLSGVILPFVRSKSWQVRTGVLAIVARGYSPGQQQGFVLHTDARYSPDDKTSAEAELDYANGALSWRARLDVRRGPFTVYGESLRLDRRSPLISIGAQSGRIMDSMRIGWQPNGRVNASVSYNQTAATLFRSQGAKLSSSTLFANLDFTVSQKARLGFRFTQQQIETAVSDSSPLLRLETRSVGVTHSISFATNWTNDFEGSLTSSREQNAGTGMESGAVLRDELHRSWAHWSASTYVNYARNLPSLASLIVRNPQLLPPALRHAFETDPARFIIVNHDALPALLAGVDLPATRSLDVGFRFQGVFSRYTLSGDIRYTSGEVLAREQRNFLANVAMSIRLDSANLVQISGARSLASSAIRTPSTLTLSYTHRFGVGSSDGFQFSRLLGLDRSRVRGRVFFDLNSNGRDDSGEPGIANLKVLLDAKHSVTTDQDGRFNFSSISSGEYNIVLSSGDLGVRLRASTPTEQSIFVSARDTIKVSFGLNNFGFVSGRVFNDLSFAGEQGAVNAPGVRGVRISLRAIDEGASASTKTETVDASGMYEFRDLAPGSYRVEIDPMTLPPDFQVSAQTSWTLNVQPLNGSYLDIPLAAQRAVSGIVFIDRDDDGQFDPNKDEVVEGARVSAGRAETRSGHNGSYVLRNLPAGKLEVHASLPSGDQTITVTIRLNSEPDVRRGVNLATVISAAVRR